MGATSLFFEGRLIFKSGSYSLVDASGLAAQGLGAAGVVAILGTADGGRPAGTMSEPSQFLRVTRPGKENEIFRSGDLYEAVPMLFEPSSDPDIPGGAQLVIAMKVNPDTQSTSTFANSHGNSLVVTSADYGAFTNQISLLIATGTNQGKRLVATLEDIVQTVDNVGGSAYFTVIYNPPASPTGTGWSAMTMDVLAGGQVRANGTFTSVGKQTDVTAGIQSALTVVSSNAGDTTQQVAIYGLVAGVPTRVTCVLNGTTPVVPAPASIFDAASVFGAIITGGAVTAGNVTIRDSAVTTLLTIAAGQVQSGAVKCSALFNSGSTALVQHADAATTTRPWYVGRNTSNAIVIDRVALAGTGNVNTTVTNFTSLEAIVLGEVPVARTVTVTGTALLTSVAVQNTLQKVADYVNARQVAHSPSAYGFVCALGTTRTTFNVALLDVTAAAVNVYNPVTGSFYADLNAIVEAINNSMDIITAVASANAVGVPDNTPQAVFLSGGSTVTAQFSDYQNALNLLKLMRINTIVPLTADPAVHAAVVAHCAYMGGVGRSERDAVVGLMNAGLTAVPSKTEIASQILSLNTRHLRAVAQSIDRFDHAGDLSTFMPPFTACLVAGAQAGSPVGTSLTFKQVNCTAFHQSSTWNPVDDAEEMIQDGLMFMEEVDGVGRRWVRNITTNVGSNNIAFTEASVNQAVNFAVFTFRTAMEAAVGKKGFAGTINAAKGVAVNSLGKLVDNQILTQSRALSIDLVVDVLEVSVEIAPIISINFVRSVLHLVTLRQAA